MKTICIDFDGVLHSYTSGWQGADVDISGGEQSCMTEVPYPAKRCGAYHITCKRCGFSALVTTAGRIDDPRTVRVPCQRGQA